MAILKPHTLKIPLFAPPLDCLKCEFTHPGPSAPVLRYLSEPVTSASAEADALANSKSIGCSHQNWRGLEPLRLPAPVHIEKNRPVYDIVSNCLPTHFNIVLDAKQANLLKHVLGGRIVPGL